MESTEKLLFSNTFGSVSNKRIVLNYKSGSEDLPIGSITSISYNHKRNYFIVIPCFLFSGILLVQILVNGLANNRMNGSEMFASLMFFLFMLLICIANWIGHHNIQVSVGGNNRKPLKVEMSKTRDGREFVNAVKNAVIK